MTLSKLQLDGRHFSSAGERVNLFGVTLGPFPPERSIQAELQEISQMGYNMVRVYEAPSSAFLDEAAECGLHVFASVPWAWEIPYLYYPSLYEKGYLELRAFLQEHADHPALSGLYIANETPAHCVHEMGKERVKDALEEMIQRLKGEFPSVLYGYANYPTTEFLELENADFTAFNVYLETEEKLRNYLQHLQIVAGGRPLLISEFGADAATHGEDGQAELLEMAARVCAQEGVQGLTLFSWSDLWYNGGVIVEGWKFGLKTADGRLRKAADSLQKRGLHSDPPSRVFLSVVVCTYNGAARISGCLEALLMLEEKNFEVIVINDGSEDDVAEKALSYADAYARKGVPLRVFTQENMGLSVARNEGARRATGEIIAYTDDDARPDRDWLKWVRVGFQGGENIGMVGGYGLPPERDTAEAQEVSRLPGQASPVLLDNKNAEHLPGCNMAVRRKVWEEVEGFRAHYRVAGDDVDFCWRVLEAGYLVHFHPCCVVWHESRATYFSYLKQQWGYGKAEALLQHDHPEKFGPQGIKWKGGVYEGAPLVLTAHSAIYSGAHNDALFQPIIYGSRPSQAQTIIGKTLEKTYLWVRAIARWRAKMKLPFLKNRAAVEGGSPTSLRSI